MSIPKALPEFRTDASPDRECKRCVGFTLSTVGTANRPRNGGWPRGDYRRSMTVACGAPKACPEPDDEAHFDEGL